LNIHFLSLLIFEKLSILLCKPKYVLDENIHCNDVTKPKNLFVKSTAISYRGASDEVVFEEARKRNLILVTRDIKFILNILMKKEDVIYETNDGERYFLNGRATKPIGNNNLSSSIRWLTRKEKRMLDFTNRTPFYLPLNGFYLVSVI